MSEQKPDNEQKPVWQDWAGGDAEKRMKERARKVEPPAEVVKPERGPNSKDPVSSGSLESFPASDPPSWAPQRVGGSQRDQDDDEDKAQGKAS